MTDSSERLSDRTFRELVAALTTDDDHSPNGEAVLDITRAERTGVPEIIFALNKADDQVVRLTRGMLDRRGRAIVSRVSPDLVSRLRSEFPEDEVIHRPGTWTVVVRRAGIDPPVTGGRVGIITAGTSDLAAAEEARIVAAEMGCEVDVVADVGVAGLHRLFRPLRRALDGGVDVIIVVAGMDGALPSVVAGLVPVPVIGLPTSTGYGYGGGGQAALMSMLQTCAPGLTVVNIDNAVGAGAAAAMIANAVARARATA